LKAAVKNVVGSCVSLGIMVEGKEANEVEADIIAGVYDKEIKAEKTEASTEKLAQIKADFTKVKSKQEEQLKKEEAEKAAAAAAAEAAKAAAPAPTAAATAATAAAAAPAGAKAAAPAAGAKPVPVKPATGKK
jgi:translation initiation factor IF-2